MATPTRIAEIEEHKVKTGETLAGLASANGMTKDELAKFNFGTAEPAKVNEHLRDDVGCTKKDAKGDFIFDDNDDPGVVLVPKEFKKSGLETDKLHTFRVRPVSLDKNFIECICVPGITFEFDKSFIRPTIVDKMKKLDAALTKFPDAKIIVFGHTDRVGDPFYNKKLSDRRAESAFAFVTDQTAIWERLYKEENWGLKIIQEILLDLGFDPGPIDGKDGPQTQAALKEFQASRGLPVNGKADQATRAELFRAYMTGKHDVKVKEDQFAKPKFMGCGEFNPLVPANENELAQGGRGRAPGNEPNRRIVFYLFKNPPKNIPCKLGNIGPCKAEVAKNPDQRSNPLHSCAFYDGISEKCFCEQPITELRIRLFDRNGEAMGQEPFLLFLTPVSKSAPDDPKASSGKRGVTDDNGDIVIQSAPTPSICTVHWGRPAEGGKEEKSSEDSLQATADSKDLGNAPVIPPEKREFEFEREVFVGLVEKKAKAAKKSPEPKGLVETKTISTTLDSDEAKKRLSNLGYADSGSLEADIRAFQRDCGESQTGKLADVQVRLSSFHDAENRPPKETDRK